MFNIVVAMDSKRGIGKNGSLAWKLKKDMAFFKDVTQSASSEELRINEEKYGLRKVNLQNSERSKNSREISRNESPIREITSQSTVIMARHTWDSIPVKFRPLTNRQNIILSKSIMTVGAFAFPENIDFADSNVPENSSSHVCSDLDAALKRSSLSPIIFVIGGGQVYQNAILHSDCHGLYITRLEGDYDCDVYFPKIPEGFEKIKESTVETEGEHRFQFQYFEKV